MKYFTAAKQFSNVVFNVKLLGRWNVNNGMEFDGSAGSLYCKNITLANSLKIGNTVITEEQLKKLINRSL